MNAEKISLYYRDGGSDKVYHTQLEQEGDGWVVNFQYGRRGSTLNAGTKTANPVPYDKAKKTYDKLVAEKTGKGYTLGEDGTPFQGTDKANQVSGLVPQLLNAIDNEQIFKLASNQDWFFQEKKDGIRCMTRVAGGTVEASNRKGLLIPITKPVEKALLALVGGGSAVLDGELIGDVYWLFDLLAVDGEDLRQCGAWERFDRLRVMVSDTENVKLVPHTKFTMKEKDLFFRLMKEQRAEGIVAKHKDAPYVPGRPNSGGNQLKHKFKSSATCMVIDQNGDKRSVVLGLMIGDCDLSSEHRRVGNVTIPVNYEIPKPGTLVEVEYLYAFPEGSLFQPVYKGPRTDKDRADWDGSQKFKQGTTDEDET